MRPSLIALGVLLAAPGLAPAQTLFTTPEPPTLVVTDGGFQKTLSVVALDVEARIVGHLAETTMTMTFANRGSRALAGDLTFPLPPGSTVSGYGLDVGGVLVDGVVVEKQEARRIFEAEVRKGIDPGLVEQVAGSAYRTRIFPIPAQGSRTVRVSYVSDVQVRGDDARYFLPLGFVDPIDDVHLRVEVVRPAATPSVQGEGIEGFGFAAWEDRQVAETRLKKARLDTPISISLPALPSKPVVVERAPDGSLWFAIHHQERAPASTTRLVPKDVTLLWDASLSRKDADHAAEIALIEAWAGQLGAKTRVQLVVFADRPLAPQSFVLPGQLPALASALSAVTYDGGTGLGALGAVPSADLYLLFSDGVANLGSTELPAFPAPVYAFNSAAIANTDALRALALRSGGAFLDLSATSPQDAVAAIGRAPFAFRSVAGQGFGATWPQNAEPVDGPFSLAGQLLSDEATLSLRFAGAGSKAVERSFVVRAADATEGTLLRRFWAQKKVADLAVGGKSNEAAMVAVGKEFGIVTPGTSLLVLERLEQYLEYAVRPPATLPGMVKDYDRQIASRDKAEKVVAQQKLDQILALWTERVAYWEQEFDLSPRKISVTGGKGGASGGDGLADAPSEEASMREMEMESDDRMDLAPATMSAEGRGAMGQQAPEAKKSKSKADGEDSAPPPSIAMRAWDPSTPYLAALKAAAPEEWLAIYLRERDSWGDAPAFFLDCSDFFAQRERPALARRVLSNLVELDLEDPALLRVFARRLVQLGDLDLAIVTFERILDLRPDEPQSHRDLALALADRAEGRSDRDKEGARIDYLRSLELLAKVVMTTWDRFAEIELIALVELNDILPRAQRLGTVAAPVDPRLIRHLDMDIRIVMSWDADLTDMDLHVEEPSGEEAYYGHARTRIGGRVSRDFTQGYGPEEYSIRRAMKGNYVVKTKFFGSRAAELQGAVTLTLDLYTDYGRPTQTHEAITIRLAENKEMFTVGEITFAGAAQAVTR